MVVALTYVGASLLLLVVLTVVYVIEDAKGHRVFLPKARERLDGVCLQVITFLSKIVRFFTHGFVRLLLHYGAHTILKRVLNALRELEARVETLVRHNKKVAREIRATKREGHLGAIADHKEEVALSQEERTKRLSQ